MRPSARCLSNHDSADIQYQKVKTSEINDLALGTVILEATCM